MEKLKSVYRYRTCLMHRLTAEKGVHQFMYFLLMNTNCCLLMHKCISIEMGSNVYAIEGGVRIGFHFNKKCVHT